MKTLVLDKAYQPISFVGDRKVAKYLAKDKVFVESYWKFSWFGGMGKWPAIVVLREFIKTKPNIVPFSFKGILRRDQYVCQYTGQALTASDATIDHIIPKCKGGKNSWENCVTTSFYINSVVKGNKTLEETGLKLIEQPKRPENPLELEFKNIGEKHEEWWGYFPNVKKTA